MMIKPEENMFKKILFDMKETIIVFFLTLFMNIDPISENLKFKNISFLYDINTNKSTFLSILIKSLLISVIFYLIHMFLK